jgi:hypothetical protein
MRGAAARAPHHHAGGAKLSGNKLKAFAAARLAGEPDARDLTPEPLQVALCSLLYAARQAYDRASVTADRLARRVRELSERLDRAAELTP